MTKLSDKQLSSLPDCYEPSLFESLTSADGKVGGPGTSAKSPELREKSGHPRVDRPLDDSAGTAARALNLLHCIATDALLLRTWRPAQRPVALPSRCLRQPLRGLAGE
ncbi:hypothetical protein XAP412_490022 [Xanthomonas phaseoli pv. phaseoli]|uniref:Uncharacterized protein n=1 Tax=Xanthomonas campestris pv. phaseoli TaxID=317013 RepID=A0AB38E1S0_XANCH|nr:hypothetical protein XAP6984_540022 [Xanthomonas phaseoli pv. phaseoli]SON86661.1 hypothetical protein XAP412_490022 [Xanthomonas phaseoli pv. phaseoli]SON90848.1 hypothetical protein XAP7430_500022 [Xanthomonas phaseoli pv. phaseoli]SOO28322.1 hypothetical protein XAP6164_2350005 [Xanthomonas phaseoli pv. phaseoli]